MKRRFLFLVSVVCLSCVVFNPALWAQQSATSEGVPAHIVVTVEPKHGSTVPEIRKEDVMVYQGRDRDPVTDWVALQGDRAGLELFILIDDESGLNVGSQLDSIKQFINTQPATTKIGVAYMQNGIARVVQNPTNDHAQAANALRLPMGVAGANASPYFSLSDLVKKWPASEERREVVIITDGIDRYYGTGDLADPYVESAADDAAKAGIIVSAIYTPGVGHFAHSYWQSYWGQLYLSELADKTGGEAYYIGFTGAPVSFTPYLEDTARRLQNQYLLSFLVKPPKKAGWQQIRITTEVPNVDLVSAGRVWVSPEQR
ncbi:MAG TPA: hypothetical protein VMP68_22340 [Candidatus Eisenbacteria bacterium]|nr:hypothetical protein [Candidatus Eisenbacteria bacterium]